MARLTSKSEQLFGRAKRVIPGGVNSPVRGYPPYPLFVGSAKGSKFRTVDGEEYIDYCMAYGALLDGHAFAEVAGAVEAAVEKGSIYGQPIEMEVELAELITSIMPSVQMIRLVSSGTEATMHAIRLARAFTDRKRILKFEGGFHGSHDSVLVKAGSGASILGTPSSHGVPNDVAKNTLVAPFNDERMVSKIVEDYGSELAAIIVEPVPGNIGPILPEKGFLETLRRITEQEDMLLIFDEVITGFRMALGGAQEYYKISPDLTILGKILGGGLPLSAFGGRKDIMEKLAPMGPVYQAGTYNGNPVSVAAGLAALQSLRRREAQVYPLLEKMGDEMRGGISDHLESSKISGRINGVASMFQIFFTNRAVTDYRSAKSSNTEKYRQYFESLLDSQVFVPPSQFETCFFSTAHSREEVQATLDAVADALKSIGG